MLEAYLAGGKKKGSVFGGLRFVLRSLPLFARFIAILSVESVLLMDAWICFCSVGEYMCWEFAFCLWKLMNMNMP